MLSAPPSPASPRTMVIPDFAFRTSTHTLKARGSPGLLRGEPGGAEISLSLAAQHVPASLLSEEMERAVAAWVMARGGRELYLNGVRRSLEPAGLDRPPSGAVQRVVTLAPSNAEIVGALGAMELLVGTEQSSDFPPEVKGLPRLGPDLWVDLESLQALKPDLVLASLTVPGMERNVTALEQTGIPYLVLAPLGLAEIGENINRVGRVLGFQEAARRVVSAMEQRAGAFRGRRAAPAPPRVYLEWWPKPMFSPTGGCWSNELIELAGGVNVFRHLPGQSAQVTVEDVVRADPEYIFVSWCGVPLAKMHPAQVLEREGLGSVSAVRNRRVVAVDECLLGRPGPRVIEGVARMVEWLQP